MLQVNSSSFKNFYWLTVDGVTEELDTSSATTFIRMLFQSSVNCILHSLMVFLVKYSLQIGFLCFTTYFGLPGHAYLLLSLKETLMERLHLCCRYYMALGQSMSISTLRYFGNGCFQLFFMVGSAFSFLFMGSMESKTRVGRIPSIGILPQFALLYVFKS